MNVSIALVGQGGEEIKEEREDLGTNVYIHKKKEKPKSEKANEGVKGERGSRKKSTEALISDFTFPLPSTLFP